MLIFGALISPFVRKVCVMAEEKGIAYELKLAPRRTPDPDFVLASPFGKIPAIKDGDYTLADSTAIAIYLDAKYPQPGLIPAEAGARGRTLWFDEYADTIAGGSGLKVLFNRLVGLKILKVPVDENLALQGEAELPRIWAYLESVAPQNGWLVGDGFTLADISVASIIRSMEYVNVAPKAAEYPRAVAWYNRVRARPAWQKVAAVEATFKLPD